MTLSDISITRPVFASVLSLLLIIFGIVAFNRLPLREYPDIDPPIVSIDVNYPGASASIVETRITQVIEERIAGIEGIRYISSSSQDGRSRVSLEFNISRDIDDAANDVRDRVSGLLDNLPEEADPPEVQKVDTSDDVIIWFNLTSTKMTVPQLTDYAERYLVDRFSVLDGVASVRIGGQRSYAMRIWLDRNELAARGLTATDVENALRAENVELPAGNIESSERQFTVRLQRAFRTVDDFADLVLGQGDDGYLVRLGDVARVEKGTVEDRTIFRGNGVPMVGLGIIKQSTADTINVADAANAAVERINPTLPEGMQIVESYDSSVFIKESIHEVYKTLIIAIILVILVIYIFLGSVRATIVPAVTVPVSIIATFTVLYVFGFSINILTLLALVLGIGLVVDDAIVVLENIVRRIETQNETPLVAAYRGTRQVGFAVIATTLVLMAVFVPITFLQGDLGRLFTEFAVTMAAAVGFSCIAALSLSAMIASKILTKTDKNNSSRLVRYADTAFRKCQAGYMKALGWVLRRTPLVIVAFFILLACTVLLGRSIPQEYVPQEDRGTFFISVNGPEGASFSYMEEYMNEIERRMQPYLDSGEITRILVRAPRGFGGSSFNSGFVIAGLAEWGERRPAREIMDDVRADLADLPGVRASPVMRQGLGGGTGKPVQFVIGGGTYEELAEWRDILLAQIDRNNPGLTDIDWDYKETKPQFEIMIDYDRAAELGVKVVDIGRTLETMLGSRRVTTYIEDGEEYDVILEGKRDEQRTVTGMENIYVRSDRSGALIPLSNFVTVTEFADSTSLNRYNRVRAITIEADLADGYTLGEALPYLEGLVDAYLPEDAVIDYKGQSRDYKYAGGSIVFVFLLGALVVFLVLAAQFESYIHPLIIMLPVPLAMAGGLLGLFLTGGSLNIYSQIGLIVLIGLSSKNGILIIEFANQLRDDGKRFYRALMEASRIRLRPILMTGITAMAGAVPLIFSSGAGAETRASIGIVIFTGVAATTFFTIFVVPAAYALFARKTGSTGDTKRRLQRDIEAEQERKNRKRRSAAAP